MSLTVSPARDTARSAASTKDSPLGSRRSSEVWLKKTSRRCTTVTACHPPPRMGDGRLAIEAPGLDYCGEGAPLGGADREHGAVVAEFAVPHQPVTRPEGHLDALHVGRAVAAGEPVATRVIGPV